MNHRKVKNMEFIIKIMCLKQKIYLFKDLSGLDRKCSRIILNHVLLLDLISNEQRKQTPYLGENCFTFFLCLSNNLNQALSR